MLRLLQAKFVNQVWIRTKPNFEYSFGLQLLALSTTVAWNI